MDSCLLCSTVECSQLPAAVQTARRKKMVPLVVLRRRNGALEVVARLEKSESGSYDVTMTLESVNASDVSQLSRDEAAALFAELPNVVRAVERVSCSRARVEIVGAKVVVRSDVTQRNINIDFSDVIGGQELVAAALSSSERERRTAEARAAAVWAHAVALREAIDADSTAFGAAPTLDVRAAHRTWVVEPYTLDGGDDGSSSSSSSSSDESATAVSSHEQRPPLARPSASPRDSSTLVRVGRRAASPSASPPRSRRASVDLPPRATSGAERLRRSSCEAPPLPPRVAFARLLSPPPPPPPGAETPSSRGGVVLPHRGPFYSMTPISTLLREGEVMHGDDDELL